jgi:2'-5' RNA ligase
MRAFIAVDAPSSGFSGLQREIASAAGWNPKDVKPIEQENFHFTLIFLGEISDPDAVKAALSDLQFEPFTITYTGVGAFPRPSSARVVWVGVDQEGGQKLTSLANDVASRMAGLGFSPDKPFSPHLTIFRVRGGRQIALDTSKYDGRTFGSSAIDRVHLKKSELTPAGPVYSNIYTKEAEK